MSNDGQFQIYLYHPHASQPHRYTRQIVAIGERTTCQEVLRRYLSDSPDARLIETCFGFGKKAPEYALESKDDLLEREIPVDDCLFDVITRNRTIKEFKIVVRHLHDNSHSQYHQRRRATMRSPSANDNNQWLSRQFNADKNPADAHLSNMDSQLMDYSLTELQTIAAHQQEQIERNKQLLSSREQRLKSLRQQQTTEANLHSRRFRQHAEQQESKHVRLKTLQKYIDEQKASNATFENDLDILKQIFLNKEHELSETLNKVSELTTQLDQLRSLKVTANKEQLQHRNELDKLKQELMIRNRLNEQQSRQIAYQRELFSSKQAELNELDRRIEELQQLVNMQKSARLTKSRAAEYAAPSNGFRAALETVQDTLSHINMAEIEKRMVQLTNSFNLISANGSSGTNQGDQLYSSNDSEKTNDGSQVTTPSKIAFASNCEIAATYSANGSSPLTYFPSSSQSKTVPIQNLATKPVDCSPTVIEEQLLPANLRFNDDILSVHFNNITSNVKKRHSFSDTNDSLAKYLSPKCESGPIHVRDDTLVNRPSSDEDSSTVAPASPANLPGNADSENSDSEQQKTLVESYVSDTDSVGSISDDIDSTTSFQMAATTSTTNLKSLLKTPTTPRNTSRRVVFDPLALLLDAAVLGELELVKRCSKQVTNPSQPNDEGLTALHNAVCASNFECVKFLVEFGCDINYADNDGWTPLHCAASCNNTPMVAFLIEHGASIYATTIRDNETAADKCEEEEENYVSCSQYLLSAQNDIGVAHNGLVYALYDRDPDPAVENELAFKDGDALTILRRGDDDEKEWWWARHENSGQEGYVPRNYVGLYPRVRPGLLTPTGD